MVPSRLTFIFLCTTLSRSPFLSECYTRLQHRLFVLNCICTLCRHFLNHFPTWRAFIAHIRETASQKLSSKNGSACSVSEKDEIARFTMTLRRSFMGSSVYISCGFTLITSLKKCAFMLKFFHTFEICERSQCVNKFMMNFYYPRSQTRKVY